MKKFQESLDELSIEKPYLFDYRDPILDPAREIDVSEIPPIGPGDVRAAARLGAEPRELPYDDLIDSLDAGILREDGSTEMTGEVVGGVGPCNKLSPLMFPETVFLYKPFHFYPKGHWGVLFSERGLASFAISKMYPAIRRAGLLYSAYETLLMATYALGRHAMRQYLAELESLRLELNGGKKYYKPYFDRVYRPTYPGLDCVERSVDSFWTWGNDEIKSPARLREVFKAEIATWPPAFAEGTRHDRESVTELEDLLAAQINQCAVKPANPPEVWGFLPHPHGSSWTRYDAVPWMVTRSLGGRIAAVLNGGPVRKTIAVHHVP